MKLLITILLRLRWAYFHIHPGYKKVYFDENEYLFHHEKTNVLVADYRFCSPEEKE